jgi:oligopeptide transport system substrate-binding protein
MMRALSKTLAMTAVLLGIVSSACKPASKHQDAKTMVLNHFRTSAHKSLDPMVQFDSASGNIISNVYDTLVEYHYLKRPYELVPNLLAAMPHVAKNNLTYTFKLRKDVSFIDNKCFVDGKGRPLVADDVMYSLKRFADANVNQKSYQVLLASKIEGLDAFRAATKKAGKGVDYSKINITGINKIDDHTFTIKFIQANAGALLPFASGALSIVAHEAVKHYGDSFDKNPVGTGPFYVSQYKRRGTMILKKNPHYHGRYPDGSGPDDEVLLADAGKQLPFIDEVHLPLIEESQPAMLKYQKGEIDWIGVDRANFQKMATKDANGFRLVGEYAKKYNYYAEPGLSSEYWTFNMKDGLLGRSDDPEQAAKNKALRQAIAYALELPGFIDKMRNGRAEKLHTIVPLSIGGSQRDVHVKWYETDLAKAKQKLAEAGYPEGKGLPEIIVDYRSTNSMLKTEFEYHRAQLAKVGIKLKAGFQTFSAFLEKVDAGNFQIAASGWAADYPDAENFYQLLYGPNHPGPNEGGYKNPEYDKLYEESRFMANGQTRYDIFEKMTNLLKEDMPCMLLYSYISFGMTQKWVGNFKRHMMIETPFKFLRVDMKRKRGGVVAVGPVAAN